MNEMPPLEDDPFTLARTSCRHAVQAARDVSIDEAALKQFITQLNLAAVKNVLKGSMGENCDTVSDEFRNGQDAANFALLFSLLQFGHGFRRELHRLCRRGASRTITLGVRSLNDSGDLSAARLRGLTAADIQQAFQLPDDASLVTLVQQLHIVVHQAGEVLKGLGLRDFADFCKQVLGSPEAAQEPAATVVRQLANHFPAFNDQGVLHDGSRVVLVKKATLAVAELCRLAAPHDRHYSLFQDFHRAIAPVDNVLPAMLAYKGILCLSPELHMLIHQQCVPLSRGPKEAELRAVALAACEQIVAATEDAFTALDLGYYLWRSGKEVGARQFARHHT